MRTRGSTGAWTSPPGPARAQSVCQQCQPCMMLPALCLHCQRCGTGPSHLAQLPVVFAQSNQWPARAVLQPFSGYCAGPIWQHTDALAAVPLCLWLCALPDLQPSRSYTLEPNSASPES